MQSYAVRNPSRHPNAMQVDDVAVIESRVVETDALSMRLRASRIDAQRQRINAVARAIDEIRRPLRAPQPQTIRSSRRLPTSRERQQQLACTQPAIRRAGLRERPEVRRRDQASSDASRLCPMPAGLRTYRSGHGSVRQQHQGASALRKHHEISRSDGRSSGELWTTR